MASVPVLALCGAMDCGFLPCFVGFGIQPRFSASSKPGNLVQAKTKSADTVPFGILVYVCVLYSLLSEQIKIELTFMVAVWKCYLAYANASDASIYLLLFYMHLSKG